MAKQTTGRVVTSKNPEVNLKTAGKVYKKHQDDGATSELKNLVDADWDITGPTIVKAQKEHDDAEDFRGKMEAAYRRRDALMTPITDALSATTKYLKGKYAKTPKKLSEWGFEIDDTPKAKKAPKEKAK